MGGWEAWALSRLALDKRDWFEALLRRCFLSGLEGSELGLGRRESLERVLLDGRWRIEGSAMVAMAFWVLSKAAAARAKMLVDDRWLSLETETVWRWEWGWAGGAAVVAPAVAAAAEAAAVTVSWSRRGRSVGEGRDAAEAERWSWSRLSEREGVEAD